MDKKMMAMGTSMLVLRLLEEEPMYGYQMIKELEKKSENVFSLKEGTLYPVLHSLEQEGAVLSFEREAPSGRKRKYYELTKYGRKLLEEKRQEWESYESAVNRVLGGVIHAC